MLPGSAFNRMGDALQHWCRECFRAYFHARGDAHRQQVAVTQRRRSERARAVVVAHLAEHPCVDCGESDLAVLEFDHVVAGQQRVASLLARGATEEVIRAEIACCDVRCANCHRRVTAQRGGWLRATRRLDHPQLAGKPTRRRNLLHVFEALTASGCVDCGTRELAVLEFDHVGVKQSNVTALAWGQKSLARLDAEIAECEVRCCNCHRRKTAERRRRRAQPAIGADGPAEGGALP
jgi:hypothetical protein